MKKPILIVFILFLVFAGQAGAADFNFPVSIHKKLVKADEGTKLKLILGNKTYDISGYMFNYVYQIPVDKTNSNNGVATNIFGNQTNNINITIRSVKVNQELMDWILSAGKEPKDGQIIVTDAESGKVTRTITFTGLIATTYSENASNLFVNYAQNNINFGMHFKTVNIKI